MTVTGSIPPHRATIEIDLWIWNSDEAFNALHKIVKELRERHVVLDSGGDVRPKVTRVELKVGG